MKLRFNPAWWAVALTLLGVSITAALASWQLNRAEQKRALIERLEQRRDAVPQHLDSAEPPPPAAQMERVRVRGEYVVTPALLQRGARQDQQPGFQLWNLFRTLQGAVIVVDRGWLAQGEAIPPAPLGEQELVGLWRQLPQAGLQLPAALCESRDQTSIQVIYPQVEDLQCLIDGPLLGGLLLLQQPADTGLIRDWRYAGMAPERHLGYAFQWAALCLTILIVFLILNLKRRHD